MLTQQNTQKELEDEEKKKQAGPAQTQAVQSSLPPVAPAAQTAQPAQPVQQQQKPKLAAGYQQRAAAVSDPRFAQALTQKFQQDLTTQQAQLAQQQQQFQQQMQAAGGAYAGGLAGAQTRINELAGKVTSGTASESDIAEYEKLQTLQFQGPQGLQGGANIAALAQMAGSPALLAQQYAQLAPGAVSGQQIAQSLSGLGGGALADIKASAAGLQQQQLTAEQAAKQQSELASRETEAIKEQAKGRIKAESEKYLASLQGEGEADTLAKKTALDRIKEGLLVTGQLSNKDLTTLGIKQEDLAGMSGIDVSQVEGLKKRVRTAADLKEVVEDLENREAANETLTPEQTRLKNLYGTIEGLAQEASISGKYAFAKKEDLAKIQALERLTSGKSGAKAGELGAGREGGKVSAATIAKLKGDISEGSGEYAEMAQAESDKTFKEKRLSGDTWYKGGITQAKEDVSGRDIKTDSGKEKVIEVAKDMFENMKKTGAVKNDLYKFLEKNMTVLERPWWERMTVDPLNALIGGISGIDPRKTAQENTMRDFIRLISSQTANLQSDISKIETRKQGMSDISRSLTFK